MAVMPKRRWFRFSLRTLFVVMTLVGCWLGYQVNWIRQRHQMLTKHRALAVETEAKAKLPDQWISRAQNYLLCTQHHGHSKTSTPAPTALRLLGETGVPKVALIFVVSDESMMRDFRHDEIERAKRLFPEAEVGRTLYFFQDRPAN